MRRADHLSASPPMFKSPVLDAFTRVHPAVPVVIFVPAITALFLASARSAGVAPTLALALAGYAFWSLSEYWLHRVVFHYAPPGALGRRIHWMIHGVHHEHPNDRLRLVMPPSVSVPLGLLVYLLFRWALGGAGFGFSAGFFGGYLAYDMVHFHVHHHRTRTWVGRTLRELHLRHHFQDPRRGFGVSAPYWDYVFGTANKASERGPAALRR